MSALDKIVEQESAKLLKMSSETEPLSAVQLECLEVLARCAKLLRGSTKSGLPDEDDEDDVTELRRRAGG